jgi:hypothetical protein
MLKIDEASRLLYECNALVVGLDAHLDSRTRQQLPREIADIFEDIPARTIFSDINTAVLTVLRSRKYRKKAHA